MMIAKEVKITNCELWMKEACEAINSQISLGVKFEVKQLFAGHKWESLSANDRRVFGRYFASEVKEGRVPNVEICEPAKNRHNQYEKKVG